MMLEPIQTIAIFSDRGQPETFKAGDVIFREDELGKCIYGVVSGEVEMFVDDNLIEIITAGDVFGVGALIHLDHQRYSTAIAKTDCQLFFLDREHFLFVVQEMPVFALEVLKSYSNRFRKLKRHFVNLLQLQEN